MRGHKKSSVLRVPTSLVQTRALAAPRLILPAAKVEAPSSRQLASLFGQHWETEVDFVWRSLTALSIAPPQVVFDFDDDRRAQKKAAIVARECPPLVGGNEEQSQSSEQLRQKEEEEHLRWLKFAPFVHPSRIRLEMERGNKSGISQNAARSFSMMPLMRFGDAAISLSIACSLSPATSTSVSRAGGWKNVARLRDAEFISDVVRQHGWSDLIQRASKSPLSSPSAQEDEEIFVSSFVAIVGAIYVQRGIDVASEVTAKLAATASGGAEKK